MEINDVGGTPIQLQAMSHCFVHTLSMGCACINIKKKEKKSFLTMLGEGRAPGGGGGIGRGVVKTL